MTYRYRQNYNKYIKFKKVLKKIHYFAFNLSAISINFDTEPCCFDKNFISLQYKKEFLT